MNAKIESTNIIDKMAIIKSNAIYRKLHHLANVIPKIALYILLLDIAFVFLYPFIYMIITSVKSPKDLVDITVQWIPKEIYWDNYVLAFRSLNYTRGLTNSLIVTSLSTVGHVFSCAFIAYGFSRYKFPGRDLLFIIVILTIIVPVQSIIFPLYIQYSKAKVLNTYIPLIMPTFFGFGLRGGLFIFIFRQFFLGLPYELEDAAKVDGCNTFRTFVQIIIPIANASILVSVVLSIVWHWNDYFEPAIYITKSSKFLLPANLPLMVNFMNTPAIQEGLSQAGEELIFNEAMVMAGVFLVILPILIVYLWLQRKFMESVERTGLVG